MKQIFYGNTLLAYLLAAGLFLLLITGLKIFKHFVLKHLKKWTEKTVGTLDDFIVKMIEKTVLPVLYFAAFYISVNTLDVNEKIEKLLYAASVVVFTFFILRLITNAIRHVIESKINKQENKETKLKQVQGIMIIINIIIWILGLIFLLDNFGYNATAFLTGLGIGGIAIALAAQNILGDLFNYFVIFFDQPFEVGDFIIVDDKKGTVEAIGIKTSRLKSLSGEQLIFANSDLTNSRIHNYKRMEKRRIVFSLNIDFQTKAEQLKTIPGIIESIIKEQKLTDFDRAHFREIGEFCFIIEVVYFVLSSDYNTYMDIQEAINLKIMEKFNTLGIKFTYPTQKLFMENFKN